MSDRKLTQASELKALSHPVRIRLFYALIAEGPLTATQLGELVDESPASVSYHLRQLATHGFTEEAPELGNDKRQRWWRAVEGGFGWSPVDFVDDPEMRATANAAKRAMLAHHWERLAAFDDSADAWGQDWVHAAFSSDHIVHLTASETQELGEELRGVLEKWKTAGSKDRDGAQNVMVVLHGFPTTP